MYRNMCCLLIPMILLASQSLYPATATNSEFNSGFAKQSRLFNKLGNNWAVEVPSQDDTSLDDADADEARVNAGLRLLEELLKARQRAAIPYPEYDETPEGYNFDDERDVQSSIPYGVHNVMYDSTGRIVRSKSRHKSTFQSLCPTKRETVFLNLDPAYEYRPDYYDEVRCANSPHHSAAHNGIKAPGTAVCTNVGFTCIQVNGTLFLTKRARGDDGCWESETRTVAAGCECMWPKHTLGDIMAHH